MKLPKIGKKFKIFLKICVAGVLLVIALTLGINAYVKNSTEDYFLTLEDLENIEDVDCVLILGCAVLPDNQPSKMLAHRLETGLGVYAIGAAPKILVSGDHGQMYYDEVSVMRDYYLELGVPTENVFMDHAGFSTYESMYRAKNIFEADKIIIVTQEYHLYRAIFSARELGIEAYGVAADGSNYSGQTYRDFREMLARVKDFFFAHFEVLPTHLGEVIPVSGDGNVTIG